MRLKEWSELPPQMQCEDVRPYYDILKRKKGSLLFKRLFDFIGALILLLLLSPVFLVLAILIKKDSAGPIFFRQVRVTQYGREFRIFKFRTMVANAEKLGTQVTIEQDPRITKVGAMIRRCRLDEIPQLLNILTGDMSFVGTRPEVPKYIAQYSPEMLATLLLPAGVTSVASIKYKDEDRILADSENPDQVYIKEILPSKMKINLESIKQFNLFCEVKLLFETILSVIKG